MKTVEINATGAMEEFIGQYQIWKNHNPGVINIQKSGTGIPCFHFTKIHDINQCQEPLVVIDCLTEGKHSVDCFKSYNRDKHYIILANEAHCSKSDLDLHISYTWVTCYYFLLLAADFYYNPRQFYFYLDKEYRFDTVKPLRFVSVIGTVRWPRSHLKDQIVERIRYKNFILKYGGIDYVAPSEQFDVINFAPGEFDPYTPRLKKYLHGVSHSLPINMYNQADFNLVVETDLGYEFGFFLTEKTIKCLITGMPFVAVATPHFLKYLKQLGFYTYSELWDESYDDELDYVKRVDKIVDLCNSLDQFDWQANRSALELIALKNRSNFQNLNRVMDRGFREFEQSILELVG